MVACEDTGNGLNLDSVVYVLLLVVPFRCLCPHKQQHSVKSAYHIWRLVINLHICTYAHLHIIKP